LWGAAHVGFAAVTFGALVLLSLVEMMNTSEKRTEVSWKLQSEIPG
jgi:hypothetical protein